MLVIAVIAFKNIIYFIGHIIWVYIIIVMANIIIVNII